MKRSLIQTLLLASACLANSQAATVTILNFDGTSDLTNVIATASTEFPSGSTFTIDKAFDGNLTTSWAANGTGTGSPGNTSPDATVTLDLSAAVLNGNTPGSFSIDTFSFMEWQPGANNQVGTWQVELFLNSILVATSGIQNGPGVDGAVDSFDFNGVTADEVLYTILTRVNEGTPGNVGSREFTLTGVIPEPSTALLGSIGMLALLRRRR